MRARGRAPSRSAASPHTLTLAGEGTYTFSVRARDGAGNVGEPASVTFTLDTSAPAVTIDSGPAELGKQGSVSFTFSASEEGSSFECSLDLGEFASCTSPQGYDNLGEGPHTFSVRASDLAGNTGAVASATFTIDTTAPSATIGSGPEALTKLTEASFTFSAGETGATLECALDGAAYATCTSPQGYDSLGEGQHTFAVRATDEAGNTGAAASATWTIDTSAPQTTITSAPPARTKDASPRLEFASEEGALFECALGAGVFAECASPHTLTLAGEGTYTFSVRARDGAGNVGEPASVTFTLDTSAPAVTIDSGPAELGKQGSVSFTFSASEEGSSFECSLDLGEFASCTSPQGYDNLGEGAHTFSVRATDLAGNTGAVASATFTIDTTAPSATIGSGPEALTKLTEASFTFSAGETGATLECALDGAAYATCTSPQGYDSLGEGQHTFAVRATDEAGNTGAAASATWTIDTSAPQTTITSAPPARTKDASPRLEFASEEGALFECALGAGVFAECASPHTLTLAGEGTYTFSVRARDGAGNVGEPASVTFTLDTSAPAVTIDSGPAETTTSTDATFTFSSEPGATFVCKLDGAAGACNSGVEYTGPLALGGHLFEVTATDLAGNEGVAASHTWTIVAPDTTAPEVTLVRGPGLADDEHECDLRLLERGRARLSAACSTGSRLRPASRPRRSPGSRSGSHFEVRGDATPPATSGSATRTWTIVAPDTTAPEVTLSAAPAHRRRARVRPSTSRASRARSRAACSTAVALETCALARRPLTGLGARAIAVRGAQARRRRRQRRARRTSGLDDRGAGHDGARGHALGCPELTDHEHECDLRLLERAGRGSQLPARRGRCWRPASRRRR